MGLPGDRAWDLVVARQRERGSEVVWCSHGQVKVLAAGDEKELLGLSWPVLFVESCPGVLPVSNDDLGLA